MTSGSERALALIREERERQVQVEDWTPEHDDQHVTGELADAAAAYAHAGDHSPVNPQDGYGTDVGRILWPWDRASFKPGTHRHNLVRAGALIVAELERLDRLAGSVQYFMRGLPDGSLELYAADSLEVLAEWLGDVPTGTLTRVDRSAAFWVPGRPHSVRAEDLFLEYYSDAPYLGGAALLWPLSFPNV